MKRIGISLCIILVGWLPLSRGAWNNDLPADSSAWNNAAGEIRNNWDHLETQFGRGITGNLQLVSVDLTNAELKDLGDTPIELIAAPGVDKLLEFVSAILILNYGSNVLVESDDNLVIEYDTGAGVAVSEVIEMTGFIDQTADMITRAIPVKDPIDASADIKNKNLALFNLGGDFTGNAAADTTLTILISYRVHPSVPATAGGPISIEGASFIFTDEDVSPTLVAEFKYDNTITGLDDGAFVWYDDDEIQTVISLDSSEVLASADDAKFLRYNWNAGAGYWDLSVPSGVGDMVKATYDVADNSLVDGADVALALNWNANPDAASKNTIFDAFEQRSVNVKTYGAVGDGVTDDTAALNAAFAVSGAEVFLPSGNYLITSNLDEPVCGKIIGAGYNETRITAQAGVTNVLKFGTTSAYFHELRDIRIQGNNTANAIGIILGNEELINLPRFTNVHVWDFLGTDAIGLDIRDAVTHLFVNCKINRNYVCVNVDTGSVSGTPTTITFVGGAIREATTIGLLVKQAFNLVFYGTVFEACTNEGVYIGGTAGRIVNTVVFNDCWFEGNWGSTTSEYQAVVDGSAATTIRAVFNRGYFNGSGSTAKSIKFTGQWVRGAAINMVQVPTLADQIRIESDAVVTINALPNNLQYSLIIDDATTDKTSGYEVLQNDVDAARAAWTDWTPIYSSSIGDAAATFTGTPTTTLARYKQVGKTLYFVVTWSGTLNAVTPAWIGISLPSEIEADTVNQYAACSISDNGATLMGYIRSGDDQGAWDGIVLQYRADSGNYTSGTAVGGRFTCVMETP